MARAQEPQPKIGGMMAPGVLESAGRARAFGENRLLEAMRQSGATQRSNIQARAQAKVAGIQSSGRQAVAAMRARAEDRRAAEQVRGARLDKKFIEGQTRLNSHLSGEREKAAREAEDLWRERDWDTYKRLYEKHEAGLMVRATLDTARDKRMERGAYRQILGDLDTWEKAEKLRTIEGDRVDVAVKNKKIHGNLSKRIKDRITSFPYISYEEEMGGTVEDFLDGDLLELGVDKSKIRSSLLRPGHSKSLERGIAANRIKADDIKKIYIILKERKEWTRGQANELVGDKDKLMEPGRLLYPFEPFDPEEIPRPSWYSWWRKKPRLSDTGKVLEKRQGSLSDLTRMLDSFEDLQDSKEPMADGSGTVGDFFGKIISGMNSSIKFNRREIIESLMPNFEQMRDRLREEIETERFDWDKLMEGSSEIEKELFQKARKAEGGVIDRVEEGEPSIMPETFEERYGPTSAVGGD